MPLITHIAYYDFRLRYYALVVIHIEPTMTAKVLCFRGISLITYKAYYYSRLRLYALVVGHTESAMTSVLGTNTQDLIFIDFII